MAIAGGMTDVEIMSIVSGSISGSLEAETIHLPEWAAALDATSLDTPLETETIHLYEHVSIVRNSMNAAGGWRSAGS